MTAASPLEKTAPAIVLRDVDLALGEDASRVHILKKLSLIVQPGERLCIVGPSGSGKSSLLMVLAGLEKPQSGQVTVAGEDLMALNEDGLANFRARHAGIVFQSFHLIPTMTALENVAVPLELAGHPNAFARAEEELKAVGLGARMTHYPAQMSGGEQQRTAIARALATRPDILFADEPTGNLDETTGESIISLLFERVAARGTTLVLITHDAELAERGTRIIRIRNGLIEDDRPTRGAAV
jgi:putative ABC transport system ATP-binding protein